MPVSEQYLDYVVDQLACVGPITAKKMFGGVGLYRDDVFFGLIAGDVLYFKVDDENRALFVSARAKPFQPYRDDSYSMSYYEVPVDVLEDTDQLRMWARGSIEAAERKGAQKKQKPRARKAT